MTGICPWCLIFKPKLNTSLLVLVSPSVLLDEIEAAESEGNDDRIEGLLCGAVKQLKMNRAKPDITLYLSLMFLAKIKPNVFATEGIIEVRHLIYRSTAVLNLSNMNRKSSFVCHGFTGFLILCIYH